MSFSVKTTANEIKKSQSIVGPIWIEVDGQNFPSEGWSDFPVVILGWWLANISPLITNQALISKCYFMDGAVRFDITKRGKERWLLTFIEEKLDKEICHLKGEARPQEVIFEVLSAAEAVIELCKQNGWESNDLITLEKEAKVVRSLMISFPE